jgi:hypothetical protein
VKNVLNDQLEHECLLEGREASEFMGGYKTISCSVTKRPVRACGVTRCVQEFLLPLDSKE